MIDHSRQRRATQKPLLEQTENDDLNQQRGKQAGRTGKRFQDDAAISSGLLRSHSGFTPGESSNEVLMHIRYVQSMNAFLSAFAQSVTKEVVQFRDGVNLADSFVQLVRHTMEFHEVAVHRDI